MDWGALGAGALIGAAATIFIGWAGHLLTLSRDRRKEYNEVAAAARQALTSEIRNPGSDAGLDKLGLERLVFAQSRFRRRACQRAVDAYNESRKGNVAQEPKYGAPFLIDAARVRAAIEVLLPFTEPR